MLEGLSNKKGPDKPPSAGAPLATLGWSTAASARYTVPGPDYHGPGGQTLLAHTINVVHFRKADQDRLHTCDSAASMEKKKQEGYF